MQDLITAELLVFSASTVGKLTKQISEKGNSLEPGVVSWFLRSLNDLRLLTNPSLSRSFLNCMVGLLRFY